MKNILRLLLCTMFALPLLASAQCPSSNGDEAQDYVGNINGKYNIQMSLVFNGDAVKGEYFYVSQLRDIALRGATKNDAVSLDELDASGKVVATFAGKLNAQCDKIEGTWQKAGSADKLPFRLTHNGSSSGTLDRRYSLISDASDEIIHANAYKFWLGVKKGDKPAVASAVDYPVRAQIAGKPRQIRSAKEFIKNYDAIFTPVFRQAVLASVPKNMNVSWRGIMLGEHGEVWLNDVGKVKSLNN